MLKQSYNDIRILGKLNDIDLTERDSAKDASENKRFELRAVFRKWIFLLNERNDKSQNWEEYKRDKGTQDGEGKGRDVFKSGGLRDKCKSPD